MHGLPSRASPPPPDITVDDDARVRSRINGFDGSDISDDSDDENERRMVMGSLSLGGHSSVVSVISGSDGGGGGHPVDSPGPRDFDDAFGGDDLRASGPSPLSAATLTTDHPHSTSHNASTKSQTNRHASVSSSMLSRWRHEVEEAPTEISSSVDTATDPHSLRFFAIDPELVAATFINVPTSLERRMSVASSAMQSLSMSMMVENGADEDRLNEDVDGSVKAGPRGAPPAVFPDALMGSLPSNASSKSHRVSPTQHGPTPPILVEGANDEVSRNVSERGRAGVILKSALRKPSNPTLTSDQPSTTPPVRDTEVKINPPVIASPSSSAATLASSVPLHDSFNPPSQQLPPPRGAPPAIIPGGTSLTITSDSTPPSSKRQSWLATTPKQGPLSPSTPESSPHRKPSTPFGFLTRLFGGSPTSEIVSAPDAITGVESIPQSGLPTPPSTRVASPGLMVAVATATDAASPGSAGERAMGVSSVGFESGGWDREKYFGATKMMVEEGTLSADVGSEWSRRSMVSPITSPLTTAKRLAEGEKEEGEFVDLSAAFKYWAEVEARSVGSPGQEARSTTSVSSKAEVKSSASPGLEARSTTSVSSKTEAKSVASPCIEARSTTSVSSKLEARSATSVSSKIEAANKSPKTDVKSMTSTSPSVSAQKGEDLVEKPRVLRKVQEADGYSASSNDDGSIKEGRGATTETVASLGRVSVGTKVEVPTGQRLNPTKSVSVPIDARKKEDSPMNPPNPTNPTPAPSEPTLPISPNPPPQSNLYPPTSNVSTPEASPKTSSKRSSRVLTMVANWESGRTSTAAPPTTVLRINAPEEVSKLRKGASIPLPPVGLETPAQKVVVEVPPETVAKVVERLVEGRSRANSVGKEGEVRSRAESVEKKTTGRVSVARVSVSSGFSKPAVMEEVKPVEGVGFKSVPNIDPLLTQPPPARRLSVGSRGIVVQSSDEDEPTVTTTTTIASKDRDDTSSISSSSSVSSSPGTPITRPRPISVGSGIEAMRASWERRSVGPASATLAEEGKRPSFVRERLSFTNLAAAPLGKANEVGSVPEPAVLPSSSGDETSSSARSSPVVLPRRSMVGKMVGSVEGTTSNNGLTVSGQKKSLVGTSTSSEASLSDQSSPAPGPRRSLTKVAAVVATLEKQRSRSITRADLDGSDDTTMDETTRKLTSKTTHRRRIKSRSVSSDSIPSQLASPAPPARQSASTTQLTSLEESSPVAISSPRLREVNQSVVAHTAFTPGWRKDEITLTPGDLIKVLETYEDGWCKGVNMSSGRKVGIFPSSCVSPVAAGGSSRDGESAVSSSRFSGGNWRDAVLDAFGGPDGMLAGVKTTVASSASSGVGPSPRVSRSGVAARAAAAEARVKTPGIERKETLEGKVEVVEVGVSGEGGEGAPVPHRVVRGRRKRSEGASAVSKEGGSASLK
ncbi:hypothetical protein HDU67_004167 [Dinochytrium kinnereticum]|nr:hypothetical protein HDU67_004167 [Dinochytrium kinnereticum]